MPRLDPPPVDVRVDGPDRPERPSRIQPAAVCWASPRNVEGEQRETDAATRGDVHQLTGLVGAQRQRFLAVDVAARLERPLRHLVVGVVDREVHDDVDRVIGQELVERAVDATAVGLAERGRPVGVEVRHRDEPDLRMSREAAGVSARDVAGADDADPEWVPRTESYGMTSQRARFETTASR